MRNGIIVTIFLCCCIVTSYAQCEDLLKIARTYKNNGQFEAADDTYTLLEKQCPNFVDWTVRDEWGYCKSKLENHSDPTSSDGYVPSQIQMADSVYNTILYFDADGNSLHNSRVTMDKAIADVSVSEDFTDWLSVEVNSYSVEVRCKPNLRFSERKGEFTIILDKGTCFQTILVQQEAKRTFPVSTTQTSRFPAQNIEEEQSVTVKISFDRGKVEPRFDEEKEWKLLKALVENKELGLQIEIPWCSDLYDVQFVQRRLNNITEHFIRSGIAKERIKRTFDEVDETDSACDCAFAKAVNK